jgi:hypothetical protein
MAGDLILPKFESFSRDVFANSTSMKKSISELECSLPTVYKICMTFPDLASSGILILSSKIVN